MYIGIVHIFIHKIKDPVVFISKMNYYKMIYFIIIQETSRLLTSLLTSEIHRNAGSMVDILEECWLLIIVP